MNKITGIYKITNKINNKSYIGQSKDIEARWSEHKRTAFNDNRDEYEFPLYRAFRKYGIENFTFVILEETESLEEREKYYINFYNSKENGYNQTSGGNCTANNPKGEDHFNHLLTTEDVIDIRKRWSLCKETKDEIYIDYKEKISERGFKAIYLWQNWTDVLPELNTEKNRDWHYQQGRTKAAKIATLSRQKLSDEEIRDVKYRYSILRESTGTIHKYYKDKICLSSIKNICTGRSFKEITI
jgi:group I intron endonuclease